VLEAAGYTESVEAIVALALIALIILVLVGYLVAAVRFVRRQPRPNSHGQRYPMGSSISGFWRYVVLREHEPKTRDKDRAD
jgi:hypothetical protein